MTLLQPHYSIAAVTAKWVPAFAGTTISGALERDRHPDAGFERALVLPVPLTERRSVEPPLPA